MQYSVFQVKPFRRGHMRDQTGLECGHSTQTGDDDAEGTELRQSARFHGTIRKRRTSGNDISQTEIPPEDSHRNSSRNRDVFRTMWK